MKSTKMDEKIINQYVHQLMTVPIEKMDTADLIWQEMLMGSLIELSQQIPKDVNHWESEKEKYPSAMLPYSPGMIYHVMRSWRDDMKVRRDEARKEVQARIERKESVPPWHVASHTDFETIRK